MKIKLLVSVNRLASFKVLLMLMGFCFLRLSYLLLVVLSLGWCLLFCCGSCSMSLLCSLTCFVRLLLGCRLFVVVQNPYSSCCLRSLSFQERPEAGILCLVRNIHRSFCGFWILIHIRA